jgi:hypothetical protein
MPETRRAGAGLEVALEFDVPGVPVLGLSTDTTPPPAANSLPATVADISAMPSVWSGAARMEAGAATSAAARARANKDFEHMEHSFE